MLTPAQYKALKAWPDVGQRKALLSEIRTAVSNIRTFQRNFDGTEYTIPCCMIWQINKILDELEAKL